MDSKSNVNERNSNGNSEIMSMHNQIVRFDARSRSPDESLHREAGLVVRLEQELTEAQICNHRLNQQLKHLVNSGNKEIKSELADTKKLLKGKTDELDQLKKQILKSNTDRVMWLSKQPQEVSTLLAEKQELRKQLDREQSEKQELFMQINSMIAQLADSGDLEEINRLKSEISSLKRDFDADKKASEGEILRLKSEIQKTKHETENSLKDGDKDKEAMELEIESLQQQLHVKNASIQSLMLAKSQNNNAETLSVENEALKRKLEASTQQITDLQTQLSDRISEVQSMKDTVAMAEVSRESLGPLNQKLAEMSRLLEIEKKQNVTLENHANDMKGSLSEYELKLSNLKNQLTQSEETVSELRKENERSSMTQRDAILHDNGRIRELTQLLSDEKDNNAILNVQLREKDGKIDRIQVDLLAAQSRIQQAEQDTNQMRDNVLKSSNDELMEQRIQLLERELETQKTTVEDAKKKLSEKNVEFDNMSRVFEETKQKLNTVTEKLNDSTRLLQDSKKDLEAKIALLQQELVLSQNRHGELLLETKALKTQPSVADEISTLMVSLTSLREDNAQYETEINSLQIENRNMREELYALRDKCTNLEEELEKAETDLETSRNRISDLTLSRGSQDERLENERKNLEAELQKALTEKEMAIREASDAVLVMKREMTEASIKSDREAQDLKEKVDSLTRDLDMTRRRMEKMEENQSQFAFSNDETKTKLTQELQTAQNNVEQLSAKLQAANLKNSEMESEWKEAEKTAKDLTQKLEHAEHKLEETKEHLQAAEELADRLQEAQILSGSVESKFANMQNENKSTMDQLVKDHSEKVRVLEERLQRAQMEHTSLETVLEEQQKECQLLQEQIVEQKEQQSVVEEKLQNQEKIVQMLNERLEVYCSKDEDGSRKSNQLEVELIELKKVNEKLEDDAKQLTASLASIETLDSEKRALENEIVLLKSYVETGKDEMKETTAENARLAGEILKFHTTAEKNIQNEREVVSKKFEERLKTLSLEKTRLASDLQMAQTKCVSLEKQMNELQDQLENADKRRRADLQQLDGLREEIRGMRDDNEKLKGFSSMAPPKTSTRTISNMSAMTNWTQADFSDCEDLVRLRTEIDKQKRLIIVLRRKLQGLQQT